MHVLLVEDDDGSASVVSVALHGCAMVMREIDGAGALAVLRSTLPDVVLTDLRGVAGESPVDYVAQLRVALDATAAKVRAPRTPIVLTSALDPRAMGAIASAIVGVVALPKPFSPRALRELVERLTAPRVGAHPEG